MLHLLRPLPDAPFPDPSTAENEPNGLLAIGGDLSPQRLVNAYRQGIFPWFSHGQPLLWWSPDPRAVLYPEHLRISRSLRKTLRKGRFTFTFDRDFDGVILGCAGPRRRDSETWLVPAMIAAYRSLNRNGLAHSVEVWSDGELAGGLYGVALGRVFFGESMFSRATDASKAALAYLVELLTGWKYALIDCQVESDHLFRLGATSMPRIRFLEELRRLIDIPPDHQAWHDTAVEGAQRLPGVRHPEAPPAT